MTMQTRTRGKYQYTVLRHPSGDVFIQLHDMHSERCTRECGEILLPADIWAWVKEVLKIKPLSVDTLVARTDVDDLSTFTAIGWMAYNPTTDTLVEGDLRDYANGNPNKW